MTRNINLGIFMPGRLESERLPNKLVLPIGETNAWDIACAKLNQISKYTGIDAFVLCNDAELIAIARRYNKIKIIKRDQETCEVDGPLNYIFKDLEHLSNTHLMFLNPCLVFLKEGTIINALIKFENAAEEGLDYATSIKKFQNWIFKKEDEKLENINGINYKRLSTKDIKDQYQAAHCFHIFNKENFFKDGMMLKKDHMGFLVEGDKELIDIDTREDYEYVKYRYNK